MINFPDHFQRTLIFIGMLDRQIKAREDFLSTRFVVRGDVCVIRLLTNGDGSSAGLVLQGEKQLANFIDEAINSLEKMIKIKNMEARKIE